MIIVPIVLWTFAVVGVVGTISWFWNWRSCGPYVSHSGTCKWCGETVETREYLLGCLAYAEMWWLARKHLKCKGKQ